MTRYSPFCRNAWFALRAIRLAALFAWIAWAGALRVGAQDALDPILDPLGRDEVVTSADQPPIDQLWRVPLNRQTTIGNSVLDYGVIARTNYLLDQRYEFTGNESTFGVESQLFGVATNPFYGMDLRLATELYLTLPLDQNRLVDDPVRESFQHNFDQETLELSQLYIELDGGDWTLAMGRTMTPFGRFQLPLYSNARLDAPFIRTESILFRETGIQLRYEPGPLRSVLAITNGSDGADTNSSKAVISRVGVDLPNFVGGVSVKWQDGIGSEGQKEYRNHAGFDCLFRRGCWGIAGEWIYDQYGMRRPGFDLDQITWGRSLYNRQINRALRKPLEGYGYYANLVYHDARQTVSIGYGQYFPFQSGDPIQDSATYRFQFQMERRCAEPLKVFFSGFVETPLDLAQAGRPRHGLFLLTGLQYQF